MAKDCESKTCNVVFEPEFKNQKHCSPRCKRRAWHQKNRRKQSASLVNTMMAFRVNNQGDTNG